MGRAFSPSKRHPNFPLLVDLTGCRARFAACSASIYFLVKAKIDAQEYFKTHKSLDLKHTDSNIGLARALKHHLLGDDAHTYQTAFYTALDALLTDQ
jgi:hypothetical protein